MKPIGTITRFYPLIDNESRELVASIMEQAEKYHEFVQQLVDRVCTTETSIELVYMATTLVWEITDLDLAEKLRSNYSEDLVVQAFLELDLLPTNRPTWLEDFRKTLEKVMTQSPPEWVLLLLHLYHALAITDMRPSHEVSQAFENAQTLLQKNSDLDCFQPLVQLIEAEVHLDELDIMNALIYYTKTIDSARTEDERVLLQIALGRISYAVVESNPKEAIEYLEESNTVCETLSVPRLIAMATSRLGYACYVTGEYDLALKCFFKAVEFAESCRMSLYFMMMNIGRIYVALEKGSDALEWIQLLEENIDAEHLVGGGFAFLNFLKAEALILLGRMTEADFFINYGHESVLKSSFDTGLGFYQHARGVYLMKQGEIEAAIDMLEEALSAFEGFEWGNGVTNILLALTKAEITTAYSSLENPGGDFSGPWMAKLEARARKRNLTGIMMQVALLKAAYLEQCNRVRDARNVLENALDITDSLSVKTLRERILEKLAELHVV